MDYTQAVIDAKRSLHELVSAAWKNTLFTPKWWMLVVFVILYYAVFFKLFDKKHAPRILLFGALMSVASFFYDAYGSEAGHWTYIVRIIPMIPSPFIYSLTAVPISFMYAYQYSHSWGKFLVFSAVVTIVLSFVFFPVLSAIKIYKLTNWSYFFYVPVLFISACVARIITEWMLGLKKRHSK